MELREFRGILRGAEKLVEGLLDVSTKTPSTEVLKAYVIGYLNANRIFPNEGDHSIDVIVRNGVAKHYAKVIDGILAL